MLKTETFGFPSGVCKNRPTSIGSPSSHTPNPGEASRLLSRSASSKRSLEGKNDSMSNAPRRSKGGVWMERRSVSIETSRPSDQWCPRMLDTRMFSLLVTGSPVTPTSPSRPVAEETIMSASASRSSSTSGPGRRKPASSATGVPARLPGV